MKGLLIKDWMMLKHQGRYFSIVAFLACIVMFTGTKDFSSFITSYLTFMVCMYTFTSFSYDEFNNGMEYLMTLPSGRRKYVTEKYVFSALLIFGGWSAGVLLRLLCFLIRFSLAEYLEILPVEPVYLLLVLTYTSCAIPVLLQFGVEKGRNFMFLSLGVFAFLVFCLAKGGVSIPLLTMIGQVAEETPELLVLSLLAVFLVFTGTSYVIAQRIMAKKEF